MAIPYLHNLGPDPILQDGNARPRRARVDADYLQNVGVEITEQPANGSDINPTEPSWDQLGRVVRASVINVG